MAVDIRLACERIDTEEDVAEPHHLVAPGDKLTAEKGFMRGHGTYDTEQGLNASVAGIVERVNKLISVRPLKTRYYGEIGDVVIGRILEVQQKRWKVDTNSRLDATLMLNSVNLPGGELRRKTVEDELAMRQYLQEGDLITAEVQNIMSDGMLSLHTRSLKYGKLSQGTLVQVSPSLVKRRKSHFHPLPCGCTIILGNNGYIWISPTASEHTDDGGFVQNLDVVSEADREVVARLRNCVLALARHRMMLHDTSIMTAYEESQKYDVKELLQLETMKDLSEAARQRLKMEEDQ